MQYIEKAGKTPARLAAVILGMLIGSGLFTFFYARGDSYFLNDPKACVNCHIMRDEYDAWNRSSHHTAATCNDCHTPHDLAGKYATKAINGWNHSKAFTLGRFGEPIQIHNFNAEIAHENCLRCHGDLVSRMSATVGSGDPDCIRCHGNVGHNNRRF